MVDFLCGLDTEVHHLLEGSHLYSPTTSMETVIQHSDTKSLIVNTVLNFRKCAHAKCGLSAVKICNYTMVNFAPLLNFWKRRDGFVAFHPCKERYRRVRKEVGFDDAMKHGLGTVMLFYGESGAADPRTQR